MSLEEEKNAKGDCSYLEEEDAELSKTKRRQKAKRQVDNDDQDLFLLDDDPELDVAPRAKRKKKAKRQADPEDFDYQPSSSKSRRKRPKKEVASFDLEFPDTEGTDLARKKKSDDELAEDEFRKARLVDMPSDLELFSDVVCQAHGLTDMELTQPDDEIMATGFKKFAKLLRPQLQDVNPQATLTQINALIGAKWKDARERLLESRSDTPDVDGSKNDKGSRDMSSSSLPASPESSNTQDMEEIPSFFDDINAYENSGSLKIKMIKRGNKLFREGDRKSGRRTTKRARDGVVDLDDLGFEEAMIEDSEESQESSTSAKAKKTFPKKRRSGGARIKDTRTEKKDKKDKKDKKKGRKRHKFGQGAEVPAQDHQSYCEVCDEGGEIILCDTCTLSFHLTCLDPPLDEPPEGDWSCPKCEEEQLRGEDEELEEEEEEQHGDYCKFCKDGGELLCCDYCPGTYHMKCLKPQLISIPDGEWKCPMCKVEELPEKVERILFWKFAFPEPSEEEVKAGAKPGPYQVRRFLVKFANMSYWQCHWIDELQLEKFHPSLYRFFCRKNDMNDPPVAEDGTESNDIVEIEGQKGNLEERFFKYGIKAEWLQVHRILWHRESKKGKIYYLVKWRELPYDQSTWELQNDVGTQEINDFDDHIKKYEELRASYDKKLKLKASKKQKLKKTRVTGNPEEKYEGQPDFIVASGGRLHDYQLEGLNWLRFSWSQGTNTILADEMGLGKTIQTISFIYSLFKEGISQGPFLISAPLSTLVNWEREFEFWAPDLYVVTYAGDKDNRAVIRNYEFSFDEDAVKAGKKPYKMKKDSPAKFHVLLTSYELVSIDANTLQSLDWAVLVVDEAHRLKNNQSKFFKVLSQYAIDYKLLLTGTPLQNNLEELFHLLNFLAPDEFHDRNGFLAEFEDIAKEDQIKKLHEILGSHMLRRLKHDVLKGIPSKSEFIVRVDLSPEQKKYYKFILTKNFEGLNAKGSVPVSLLNIMMELKKCCNHPYLFAIAAQEAKRTANGAYEVKGLTEASGKLLLLEKMLTKLKLEKHRVLIFSQMTRMLDLLEDFFEGHGWKYERLDGSVTGQVRQACIDRFNAPGSDTFAFLLSTRAGGLGINLATADTVFIYDSDWNPHNDIQAFSRAHRIGQENKVMIYRFVTRGTVEERITQVAKKKMMLTHLVVRPGIGTKSAIMSKRELDDILRFGTEDLFKDEDDTSDSGRIVYDDTAVSELLDRSQEGVEQKENTMNEYLSSFKVASYVVKEKEETEIEVLKQEAEKPDPEYWEKLLRHHYEQEQEYIASTLGKGKRIRKQVNYTDSGIMEAEPVKYKNLVDDGSDFEDEINDEEPDEEEDEFGNSKEAKFRRGRNKDELPPLLAKVAGHIQVYGFNPRQRRSFLSAVMRFGLPPKDFKLAKTKWCIHNLRGKTEKAFQAYTSMFLRHLCEPGADKTACYSDGVPREGVNRMQVLSRIGIMSLIRRKVEEYATVNLFIRPVLFDHLPSVPVSMTALPLSELPAKETEGNTEPAKEITKEKKEQSDVGESKSSETQEDDSKVVKEEDKKFAESESAATVEDEKKEDEDSEVSKVNVEGLNSTKPSKIGAADTEEADTKEEEDKESKENDATATTPATTTKDDSASPEKAKTEVIPNSEVAKKSAEGSKVEADPSTGSTETLADEVEDHPKAMPTEGRPEGTEEEKPEKEKESDDSAEKGTTPDTTEDDPRQLENPETASSEKEKPAKEQEIVSDVKVKTIAKKELPKFMFNIADGGFTELHVLWEAEEKRKFDNIWWRYHDYWLLSGVVCHGYGRWQDIQNDPRFDAINRPFQRMSLDYKNKFIARRFKLLEQALIVEEQLRRAALMNLKQDNTHPAMALQSRFAELECLAESHQHLSKESLAGNKPANAVLHKVLNQLENLLADMKADVSRLPNALSKMAPVTHRLGMSERSILSRLANGGKVPVAAPMQPLLPVVSVPIASGSPVGSPHASLGPSGLAALPNGASASSEQALSLGFEVSSIASSGDKSGASSPAVQSPAHWPGGPASPMPPQAYRSPATVALSSGSVTASPITESKVIVAPPTPTTILVTSVKQTPPVPTECGAVGESKAEARYSPGRLITGHIANEDTAVRTAVDIAVGSRAIGDASYDDGSGPASEKLTALSGKADM